MKAMHVACFILALSALSARMDAAEVVTPKNPFEYLSESEMQLQRWYQR